MTQQQERSISAVLLFLVAFDAAIFITAFFFPQFWFSLFHGTASNDPQGLLRRAAASWLAFAVFQCIAYLKWRSAPQWLTVAAGIRLGDIFTDWAYLYFAEHTTHFGQIGLFLASPVNALLGWFFLRSYMNMRRDLT